jgi:carboxypeptidase Q
VRYSCLLPFALTISFATTPAAAQFGGQQRGFTHEDPVLRRIWSLGMDSSQGSRLGQVLMDSIGPRLTGTPQMAAAADWAVRTYTGWGISARRENYGTWRGWRRGRSRIDLVQPRLRSLEATQLAWSPGTAGRTVRGEVIVLPDLPDSAAFARWLPQVRGKYVMISFPNPTCRPDDSWREHADSATFQRMRAERDTLQRQWTQRVQRTGYPGGLSSSNLARRMDGAGAAGILTSGWSGGWGVSRIFSATTQRTPVYDVMCEDYGLLYRLAANNQGPLIEAFAESEFLGEVPAFNVIAEIRGRELPDEYVMLSAHFDSWDGASGATDNGTGTVVMMEAMRLLRAVYPSPRRTILVGHWGGEELGLIGSRAFAADNPRVVEGLQALFNQDNGTGRVVNVSASGLIDATGPLARWLARVPLDITRDIRFGFAGSPAGGGSDHAAFVCSSAPGFSLGSGSWDYGTYTWHTNRDTWDKVSWADVRQNATLTAMLVYLASEESERVPRARRTVMPSGPGGQGGSWPACQTPARATPQPPPR